MTITKILVVTTILTTIILLTTAFKRQESGLNKYVTMVTYEAEISKSDSKIIIVYEDDKIEEIELERFRPDNFGSNATKINKALNSLASKGYELVSTTGLDIHRAMYTFVKK